MDNFTFNGKQEMKPALRMRNERPLGFGFLLIREGGATKIRKRLCRLRNTAKSPLPFSLQQRCHTVNTGGKSKRETLRNPYVM